MNNKSIIYRTAAKSKLIKNKNPPEAFARKIVDRNANNTVE